MRNIHCNVFTIHWQRIFFLLLFFYKCVHNLKDRMALLRDSETLFLIFDYVDVPGLFYGCGILNKGRHKQGQCAHEYPVVHVSSNTLKTDY